MTIATRTKHHRPPTHHRRATHHVTAFLAHAPLSHATRPCSSGTNVRCAVSQPTQPHTPSRSNAAILHSPVVHRYEPIAKGEPPTYAMWYTCHHPNLASVISLATSEDGLHWDAVEGPHQGAVLAPNDEQWWAFDTRHVSLGDVVSASSSRVRADGDVCFMYYTGADEKCDPAERYRPKTSRIGVAISKDGQHFSRFEGEFPSGAVIERGAETDFDHECVSSPCVTQIERRRKPLYVMHYHTYSDSRGFEIGRAESTDGIAFRKVGKINMPVTDDSFAGGLLHPFVIEQSGRYFMYMEVIGADSRSSIAMCESNDCDSWSCPTVILKGCPGEWNASVGCPYGLAMDDGSLRIYYCGADDGDGTNAKSCIAVAESAGSDWTCFKTQSRRVDVLIK